MPPLIQPDTAYSSLEHYDWVRSMHLCPQDAIHHAEGDVWTHTQMVLDELKALPEFQSLNIDNQNILRHAALLHDVAKPVCTRTENDRIVSPGHAKTGESMARSILWDMDFTFREQVCALVRLHGLPLWGFEKPVPERAAILAGWRTPNILTWILAKADALGRITSTKDELLYRLDLYRELCLDNNCFHEPHPWFNEHSRFRYFWSDEKWPVEVFDDTRFEVVLMSGIPGSGKDTWVAKNAKGWPVISLDAIREELNIKYDDRSGQGKVAQTAYERAKAYCRKQQSFVWNSTNLTADLRARLIQTLRVYQPRFKIVYVETSQKNILERRGDDIRGTVLERMLRQLEMPLAGEAHEVVYVRN